MSHRQNLGRWAAPLLFAALCAACSEQTQVAGDNNTFKPSGGGTSGGSGGAGGEGLGGSFGGFGGEAGRAGGSGSGSAGAGGECEGVHVNGTRIPANMLFLVDRSGSMSCNLPPTQTSAECEVARKAKDVSKPTKWPEAKKALTSALAALKTQGDVRVGLNVFPRADGALQCSVASDPDVGIEPLTDSHLAGIEAFLGGVSVTTQQGKTPLAGATILGYRHLHQERTDLDGPKFVVLLTDGAETCDESATGIGALVGHWVDDAASVGIRTYVIGVPGSEPARAVLSEIAFRGQTGASTSCTHGGADPEAGDCHFDLTRTTAADLSAQLEASLAKIRESIVSCEFELPDPPQGKEFALDEVNVSVAGVTYAPTPTGNCATETGWQYSPDKKKILLCGAACVNASDPDAEIDIQLFCPTIPVPA